MPDVMNRISNVQWNLDQYKRLAPGLDAWHPIHSERPEECILTLASTFDSQQYSATYPVKSYDQWLLEHKHHSYAMSWHKQVLQTIQSGRMEQETKKQWVLKTPYYLALLDDIRKEYPDALVIHTHRNPSQVLASASSVHAKTYGIVSDQINLYQIGHDQVAMQQSFLERAMATRKKWTKEEASISGGFPHAKTGFNVIDVHLKDLQTNTIGEIRRIFIELLQRELTNENEAAMLTWLKKNKRGKHGRHSFNKKDFGINVDGNEFFTNYELQFQTKNAAAAVATIDSSMHTKKTAKETSMAAAGKEL